MSLNQECKKSFNRTGVMFYNKIPSSQNYRVRFKSFNLSIYDNQPKINEMDRMYKNYVLFKEGKSTVRQRIPSSIITKKQNEDQKYKTNKQRLRQNQNLRTRLKSMKNQRKSFLQKIKQNTNLSPEQPLNSKDTGTFITKI